MAKSIFQADGESSDPKQLQLTIMPFDKAHERTPINNTHKLPTKAAPRGKTRGRRRKIAAMISSQARVSASGIVQSGGTNVKGISAMANS
jgi:ATP adenylyltransferase/5',5'''-P-1,P-4-tetraphosphate phosphorylase II